MTQLELVEMKRKRRSDLLELVYYRDSVNFFKKD